MKLVLAATESNMILLEIVGNGQWKPTTLTAEFFVEGSTTIQAVAIQLLTATTVRATPSTTLVSA